MTTITSDERTVRRVSRRLRDLCEPIASCVYFAPEAFERYQQIGLDDYAAGYFTSRGACMGRVSGEVVTATFGVFNPEIVIPAVDAGWSKTDPETVLAARQDGATAAVRRMIGEPDTARAVEILRDVMEPRSVAGRSLFAGLRSLPFPDDPIGALWRACDYVREHRGDGHIAAWVGAGVDPVEIGLLTECYWGMKPRTYIRTRGWSDEQLDAGVARLEARGLLRDDAFTDAGRELRRGIEFATDAMETRVVDALGEGADELFEILEPWTKAILDAKGYPADPAELMNRDDE